MTREEVLNKAAECVTGQREEDYGSPENNFSRIAQMWSAYLGKGVSAVDVANMMTMLKIARSKKGYHADNFVDMAGYAACAGEIAASEAEKGVRTWSDVEKGIADKLTELEGLKEAEKGLALKVKFIGEPYVLERNGDWIDLRAAERVVMTRGELKYIRLGVAMQLPEGYEAHVLPRSSTPKTFGIICANSMGIIDNSYCGDGDEWRFPAYATRLTTIEKGDRICQFRIEKVQPEVTLDIVDELGNPDRGGIGSTGVR